MCSQSFEKEEGVLLANCQRVTHVQDPSRRATTTHARYAKRYELDIWIYQNNFENLSIRGLLRDVFPTTQT